MSFIKLVLYSQDKAIKQIYDINCAIFSDFTKILKLLEIWYLDAL